MIKKIVVCFLCITILSIQLLNAEEKFLSLKKNKVNVRYGPSFDFEIKYIYKKINLPLKQIDKKAIEKYAKNQRKKSEMHQQNGYGNKTMVII